MRASFFISGGIFTKKVSVTIPQQTWGTIKTKYASDSLFVRLDELTGSSKNFDSLVNGNITKRLGGANYEASADTDGPNKDQFEAIFTDGVHHLLKVVAGKLKFSSGGGTFTLVTAGYSILGNFEFALFSDRVYFDNGIDSPQVYDRTTSYGGVSYAAPQTKIMGAQAPVTPVTFAADTAGGAVPAGGHTYKTTFLYYDFEESNGSPSSALHTVANPNNTVHLTAVPIGGYGVTARKIYRDDNDGVYRLVGTINDNTTVVFTDTASTGTALIPTTNNVPPSFKYITTNLDRTWIAGIPGDPSSLRFSEAGLPDVFPSANDILCNPEDPITALVVYDKKVYVFNRNSFGRILGSTRDSFQYVPFPGAVGCVDNRSIRVRTIEGVPTLVWLSDKGVWGTNGSSVEYLSDAIEDLVNLNIQQASQVKGQNAQTSQSAFQAGTASPGIDLTTLPGTITTPNPKRVWDDEADWEGGSSLTNIVTNDGTNQIKVPTAHAPIFSDGTHANTQEVSSTLRLPLSTDFTGENVSFDSLTRPTISGSVINTMAFPFSPTRSGNVTSFTAGFLSDFNNNLGITCTIWNDVGGIPNTQVGSLGIHLLANQVGNRRSESNPTWAGSVTLSAGVNYWFVLAIDLTGETLGAQRLFDTCNMNLGTVSPIRYTNSTGIFGGLGKKAGGFTPRSYETCVVNGTSNPYTGINSSYVFVSSALATSGIWIGPIYDSKSDSAVSDSINHTGVFPSGTSSTTTVEASNVSDLSSGITSQNFSNLNGSSSVSTTNKRYWRVKIQLTTNDDRTTPQIGFPTLKFNTTAVWISEVIDHTTDITLLNSLSFVTNVPAGTTATLEIATSANNITYTAFGSLGSAVVQRYSKLRITLTATGDDMTTPTVTSAELDWTLVSNLISSAIDTGNTPAGWDIFQAQFALNGGTILFYMRSATTAIGLAAESFVAVTNGTFPTIPVRRFVQWKVIITSTADVVPTVDSVTVNWFISQTNSIRVASLFFNRSYYLAAAEFNQTTNNLVIVLDGEGKWRTYRGINVNTLGLFFNDPYYGSALEGRIIRFLLGATDQGTAIEMVLETKAIDFGDMEHDKIGRKVYVKGKNTGAVYQVFMSFDNGTTYTQMIDVITGATTFTTTSDNTRFRRRFQLNFALGNVTSGKTVKIKIVESTAASAEIDGIKIEAWVRQGELVA